MISEVYYSVFDCGDGSVYPIFFEDKLCAELQQELQNVSGKYFGETCVGSLKVESKSPIQFLDIVSREEFVEELQEIIDDENNYYDLDFVEKALEKLRGI